MDWLRQALDWLGGRCPRYGAWRSRRGSAFLEYAMLAALIGIVGAVGVMYFGEQIKDFFKRRDLHRVRAVGGPGGHRGGRGGDVFRR